MPAPVEIFTGGVAAAVAFFARGLAPAVVVLGGILLTLQQGVGPK